MPGPVQRNHVVKHFGTPDITEGTVNEPRERQEHGMRFNEKWVYKHPPRDPADAGERIIYWRRYDYVGSLIKRGKDAEWEKDDNLPQALQMPGA